MTLSLSRLWIFLALALPAFGSQALFETAEGFTSSAMARDISRSGVNFYLTNVTALASGALKSSGASNMTATAAPIAGNYNSLAMALTGAPAVTVAFFVKFSSISNSDIYNNLLFVTRCNASINSGQWINITSNRVLFAGRSTPADSFLQIITSPITFSNKWVHLACVFDYANGRQIAYANGVLLTNAAITFAATTFKPSPVTNAVANDSILGDAAGTRARNSDAIISPIIVEPRAWMAADVLFDKQKRGERFPNP